MSARLPLARPMLGLGLFGAALATVLDREHVTHRVLAYTHPTMGVQAWWAPLLFGVSTLVVVNQARLLRGPGDSITPGRALLHVVDFAAAYLLTSLFRDAPWWLALGLFAAWVAYAGRHGRRWLLGLTLAVAGPLVEITLTHLGAFYYLPDQPLVLGVPVWLPALYLHVSLAARALDLWLLPAPVARRVAQAAAA